MREGVISDLFQKFFAKKDSGGFEVGVSREELDSVYSHVSEMKESFPPPRRGYPRSESDYLFHVPDLLSYERYGFILSFSDNLTMGESVKSIVDLYHDVVESMMVSVLYSGGELRFYLATILKATPSFEAAADIQNKIVHSLEKLPADFHMLNMGGYLELIRSIYGQKHIEGAQSYDPWGFIKSEDYTVETGMVINENTFCLPFDTQVNVREANTFNHSFDMLSDIDIKDRSLSDFFISEILLVEEMVVRRRPRALHYSSSSRKEEEKIVKRETSVCTGIVTSSSPEKNKKTRLFLKELFSDTCVFADFERKSMRINASLSGMTLPLGFSSVHKHFVEMWA